MWSIHISLMCIHNWLEFNTLKIQNFQLIILSQIFFWIVFPFEVLSSSMVFCFCFCFFFLFFLKIFFVVFKVLFSWRKRGAINGNIDFRPIAWSCDKMILGVPFLVVSCDMNLKKVTNLKKKRRRKN